MYNYSVLKGRLYQSVVRKLLIYDPPPAVLLDVGCAYGGMLFLAKRAGYATYGSDICTAAVEWLKEKGMAAEVAYSVMTLSSNVPKEMDCISCLDCNMYWPDQPSELKGIYARLKPGGIVVFRVVSKSWMFALGLIIAKLSSKCGMRICRSAVNDHRFSMPLRSFVTEVAKAGFQIKEVSPWDAIHSKQTAFVVKLFFAIGTVFWKCFGVNCTLGALVVAQRPVQ